jgi:hypothetical protein
MAAAGVALLVAGGTAGTYLAVASSLGGVNNDGANANQAGANANQAGANQAGGQVTQPMVATETTPNSEPTPPQRTHRRAAAAPAKPADIRPVVPPPAVPAPTPTKSVEATPTPTSTPSATPTPSPSVSTATTDDASAQFANGHRWRHRGQTGDGR